MLSEVALKIIFLKSEFVMSYITDLEKAYEDYELTLECCTSLNEIRETLELDIDTFMPVTYMVDTFEKYLSLNRNDTEILRYYAEYINALIPDWSDYSEQLLREARNIDLNRS